MLPGLNRLVACIVFFFFPPAQHTRAHTSKMSSSFNFPSAQTVLTRTDESRKVADEALLKKIRQTLRTWDLTVQAKVNIDFNPTIVSPSLLDSIQRELKHQGYKVQVKIGAYDDTRYLTISIDDAPSKNQGGGGGPSSTTTAVSSPSGSGAPLQGTPDGGPAPGV